MSTTSQPFFYPSYSSTSSNDPFARSNPPFKPLKIHFVTLLIRHSSSRRVQNKVIIVTGCNSPLGIGRASAHQFAQNGARALYICDYNTQYLETHKREINSLYPSTEVHVRKVDAGAEEDVRKVVDDALETYGRLDIFFANAGVNISQSRITEASADEFMQVMKTNALG